MSLQLSTNPARTSKAPPSSQQNRRPTQATQRHRQIVRLRRGSLEREHYRIAYTSRDRLVLSKQKGKVFHTIQLEEKKLACVKAALGNRLMEVRTSKNGWYKLSGDFDITVVDENDRTKLSPLTEFSAIAELNAQEQQIYYVKPEDAEDARKIVKEALTKFDAPPDATNQAPKQKETMKRIRKRTKKHRPPTSPETQPKKKVASTGSELQKKEVVDAG